MGSDPCGGEEWGQTPAGGILPAFFEDSLGLSPATMPWSLGSLFLLTLIGTGAAVARIIPWNC